MNADTLFPIVDEADDNPHSFYATPTWFAELLLERYFPNLSSSTIVIEPSCGEGHWLAAFDAAIPVTAVEIEPERAARAEARTGRNVIVGDFTTVPLNVTATAIIGNPPFSWAQRGPSIDAFLERSYDLLEENGQAAFILPAYFFQTARPVVRLAEKWSIEVEFVPRNIFPDLSKPLTWARFTKNFQRKLVGFFGYREAYDVLHEFDPRLTRIITNSSWREAVEFALKIMGGQASLKTLYRIFAESGRCLSTFWQEKIRQVCQAYFVRVERGVYALGATA